MDPAPALYLDRWAARPGERVLVRASGEGKARVSLVRLAGLQGSPTPNAYIETPVTRSIDTVLTPQDVPMGSCARAGIGPSLAPGAAFRWSLRLFPTLLDGGEVLSWGRDGPRLRIVRGGLEAIWRGASLHVPLEPRAWWSVDFQRDDAGALHLDAEPAGSDVWFLSRRSCGGPGPADGVAGPLEFGRGFNGKIENPSLEVAGAAVAAWDFAADMTRQDVPGRGPGASPLVLVNTPRRAVTSSAWTGEAHDWTHRPEHYAAIHFHEDDLSDCLWPPQLEISVPLDARGGVYAVRVETAAGLAHAPLFVRAARPPTIAFLASTFSYLAYGNTVWSVEPEPLDLRIRSAVARARRFGLSTYCRHRDGTGVGFTSMRRPILNATPGFLGEAVGGQVLFNDDLRIIAWLEHRSDDYDVVTDHELHERGADALKDHRVLITGSHPEYHSHETLDACERHVNTGGRLMYMGGNGFYWRVDTLADAPHVIELRRAEGGIRMWAEPSGEYHHQSDGRLGGLWRRIGRPPNRLLGVGYSAQGSESESRPFVRTTAAADPRAAFLFEGVGPDPLGATGRAGVAAAGYEVDRLDALLGTPPHALVVARSEPFGASTMPVNEERLTHTRLDCSDPLRADITFHERSGGGAVIAFGSVLFAACLTESAGIGRLATNALNRFDRPDAFELPQRPMV